MFPAKFSNTCWSLVHKNDGIKVGATYKATDEKIAKVDGFISACEKIGIPKNDDYNGINQNGVSLVHSTIKNGKRHSGAAAFLKPVLNRSNLTAITNAQVCRIILKDKKAIVKRFEYLLKAFYYNSKIGKCKDS